MTQILTKREAFKDDQYILATQVKQCFYPEDMANTTILRKKVNHEVAQLPNIIDLDKDDDIIDDEDALPQDLADSDDEDLVNVDDDDGVKVVYSSEKKILIWHPAASAKVVQYQQGFPQGNALGYEPRDRDLRCGEHQGATSPRQYPGQLGCTDTFGMIQNLAPSRPLKIAKNGPRARSYAGSDPGHLLAFEIKWSEDVEAFKALAPTPRRGIAGTGHEWIRTPDASIHTVDPGADCRKRKRPSPEFGGASGSGGCGDDEPGGDEDDDEDDDS
ncbi:hypothetical protein Tco_1229609 [Tanacetum coccineum]